MFRTGKITSCQAGGIMPGWRGMHGFRDPLTSSIIVRHHVPAWQRTTIRNGPFPRVGVGVALLKTDHDSANPTAIASLL